MLNYIGTQQSCILLGRRAYPHQLRIESPDNLQEVPDSVHRSYMGSHSSRAGNIYLQCGQWFLCRYMGLQGFPRSGEALPTRTSQPSGSMLLVKLIFRKQV